MRRCAAAMIAGALMLAPAGLRGAGAGETPTPSAAARDSFSILYRLEEIVVYGRRPRHLSMVSDLRAGEIAARGGGDMAHTLRFDPALSVTAGAKAETETRIRGFPARSVLVLVDGRPINPGYYGKADLSMIPSVDIAAVQVVKGPASAAYAPGGMGGVINVITRGGLEAPGTDLGLRLGGDGLRRLSVGHGAARGGLRYRVSAYEQYRDGFSLSESFEPTSIEDGGRRTNSGYHKAGGALKASYDLEAERYTLTLSYHWSRREIPPTIYSWDDPRWRCFPRWVRYGASLSNERRLGDRFEMTTVLYADTQADRLVDYSDRSLSAAAIDWDSRLKNRTLGGSVSLESEDWGRHRLHSGLSFRYDGMQKQPDTDAPWVAHSIRTGSIFLEDRYSPWAATTLTAGVQAAYFASGGGASPHATVSPTLALRRTLPGRLEARAAYARAVRFATLHMLYSESSGNPRLLPETADKFELGLERWFLGAGDRHLGLEAAYFRNELTDLIYRPARSRQFRNIGQSLISGFEAALQAGLSELLGVEAGYVWIDRGASTAEITEELSPHRFSLAVTVAAPWGLRARYDFSALDERTTFVPGLLLSAYRYHGLTVTQALGSRLSLQLEIFNLTDADYEDELGYPAPGRQFSAGFDWRM